MKHKIFSDSEGNSNLPIKLKILVGWVILLASYIFLFYKLYNFENYPALLIWWKHFPLINLWWIIGVFLLLPFNWMVEVVKWRALVSKVEQLTLKTSFFAVLAGITTGFVTPNRVGDMVGRVMYLAPKNRKSGITLSIVNGLTQNIIIALVGLPAAFLFFNNQNDLMSNNILPYFSWVFVAFLFIFLLFLLAKYASKRYLNNRFFNEISLFVNFLSNYSKWNIISILLLTLLRYVVFCFQFYFMLRFFGVEIGALQFLIAIPVTYLFVTFTPSFAFSEAAVRSSYAVLVIGVFFPNEVPIILAGLSIWIVNTVLPVLLGSVYVIRKSVK